MTDIRKILISCFVIIPLWNFVCYGQTTKQENTSGCQINRRISDILLPYATDNLNLDSLKFEEVKKQIMKSHIIPSEDSIYSDEAGTIRYDGYLDGDSTFRIDVGLFALTKVIDNKNIFAISYCETDSLLEFYRLQNKQWKEIGRRKPDIEVYMIDFEELNGKPCLEIVAGTHYNMNGNSWKECFVYFPKEDTIKYAGSFCTDYTVNWKDTTLCENYECSLWMSPHKILYKWHNDELIPVRMAILAVPGDWNINDKRTLKYYELEYYETVTGSNPKSAAEIFEINNTDMQLIFREKYKEHNKKHRKYWDNFFEIKKQTAQQDPEAKLEK